MYSGNDENSLSGFEAFLSKELAATSKENEATRNRMNVTDSVLRWLRE